MENKLKSNKLLSIPKNINTDSISLYKNYDDEYTYSVSMSNDKCNIYTSVDAKTGEIKYYSRWGEDDSEVKNDDDSALKTLAGDKAKEYKYDENSHQYIRYVNVCAVRIFYFDNDFLATEILFHCHFLIAV